MIDPVNHAISGGLESIDTCNINTHCYIYYKVVIKTNNVWIIIKILLLFIETYWETEFFVAGEYEIPF